MGDEERGVGLEPTSFFCVRVREKIAWERDDWAFMSVSLVRRIAVPLRIRLHSVRWLNKGLVERGHSPHNFGRSPNCNFPQAVPDDVPILILADLYVTLGTRGLVWRKQVDEILVVKLQERPFDAVGPRAAAFVSELIRALEDGGDGSGNNAHPVVWVRWVRVEVYAGHGERLPTARLAVSEDGTIEAIEKAREERLRGRHKCSMLR